jgi:hypothetical protein
MKCFEFNQLIEYGDGQLVAATAQAVAAHLATGCDRCASVLAWYSTVKELSSNDHSVEPPAWVVNRAVKLFESNRERRPLVKRLGELVASLVYDSFAQPVLNGARSAEAADHQLLYKAGDYNIDLLLASSSDDAKLRGQILREGELLFESTAGISLDLISEGKPVLSTRTNEVGEFVVGALRAGSYDLRVDAGDVTITIAGLAVV